MEKLLSICIPTYNMEGLLTRCLDSFIVEKDYMEKLEVIIVNDGSKDNSSKIAHKYAERYPNTYIVIDKSNGNYGSCINAALKIASGKYFRICDADDRYENANMVEYLRILKNTSSDIVFSPFIILNYDSTVNKSMESYLIDNGRAVEISSIDWTATVTSRYRAMHSMAVKPELLRNNNYHQTEGISYTDTQFVFYSILYSNTCSFFNKAIYYYYLGRDGQTMSTSSMIKSNMHFYKNAEVMLQSYCCLPAGTPSNKAQLLYECINTQMTYFVGISIGNIAESHEQQKLIDQIVAASRKSMVDCPLQESLLKNSHYKMWKKYHIPPRLIYRLVKLRNSITRN